jgi:hypothetical protein
MELIAMLGDPPVNSKDPFTVRTPPLVELVLEKIGLEEPLALELTLAPAAIVIGPPDVPLSAATRALPVSSVPATIFQEAAFMFVPIVTVWPLFRLTSWAYPVVVAAH